MKAWDIDALAWTQVPDFGADNYDAVCPKKPPFYCNKNLFVSKDPSDSFVIFVHRNFVLLKHYSATEDLADLGETLDKSMSTTILQVRAFAEQQQKVQKPLAVPVGTSNVASSSALVPKKKKPKLGKVEPKLSKAEAKKCVEFAEAAMDVVDVEQGVGAEADANADAKADADVDALARIAELENQLAETEKEKQTGIAELEKQLAETEKEKQAAQDKAANSDRLHKQYMKRNQGKMKQKESEIQRERQQAADAVATVEQTAKADKMKLELELSNAKSLLCMTDLSETEGEHPKACYDMLLRLATDSLVQELNSSSSSSSSSSSTTSPAAKYEFFEFGVWSPITNASNISELDKLESGKATTVTYTIGNQTYEVRCVTDSNHEFMQKNTRFLSERPIRIASKHIPPAGTISQEKKDELLFGKTSYIKLSDELLDKMLADYRFKVMQLYEIDQSIADLAELFSSLGSNFKYSTKSFGGKKVTKCEKWVKPPALFHWLSLAKARGYRFARVVAHGGSLQTYDGVRNDPVGFDLQYANQNGQARGNGLYFGLSDHITVRYNAHSGYPPGTFIIGLMLMNEKTGLSHESYNKVHGGVTTIEDNDKEFAMCYQTFELLPPTPGKENAIVVHEGTLVLPLGLAVAVDKTMQ